VCILHIVVSMYSNQELADMHFLKGFADGNAVVARPSYQEGHPGRRCLQRKSLLSIHHHLCAHRNMEMLHLALPTVNDQNLRLLK
jgi:hypothetical protein